MIRYAAIGAAAVITVLALMLVIERGKTADLEVRNASLQRSVAALAEQREQAREAQAVARAETQRLEVKAKEYDAIREALLRGDADADLPDWFCEHLGLLGLVCRADD